MSVLPWIHFSRQSAQGFTSYSLSVGCCNQQVSVMASFGAWLAIAAVVVALVLL